MKTQNKLFTLLIIVLPFVAIMMSCTKDEDVISNNKLQGENAIVDVASIPIPMPEVGFDINKLCDGTQKWGANGHTGIVTICAKQWGLSDARANKMAESANLPDSRDNDGTLPLTQQWRHGYVYNCADGKFSGWGKADWWCNNVIGGTGWKDDNASSCFYFYPGDYPNGDYALGYACHYLADLGNAWHATGCIMSLLTHTQFENWVEANWSTGWNFSASIDNNYYSVTDPAATVRKLAKESYNVSSQMNTEFNASKFTNNDYVKKGTSTLVSLTQARIRETGRYIKGLIKYTLDHEGAWYYTTSIKTNKDSEIDNYSQTANFGSATYMDVCQSKFYNNRARLYTGFDISSAPAASRIASVKLYLYCYTSFNRNFNTYFERVTGSWTESGITWSNQPAVTTTNRYTHSLNSATGWSSYDVTNLYKDAKNAGGDFSLRLMGVLETDPNVNDEVCYRTKEYSSSYAPYIVISYK